MLPKLTFFTLIFALSISNLFSQYYPQNKVDFAYERELNYLKQSGDYEKNKNILAYKNLKPENNRINDLFNNTSKDNYYLTDTL